MRLGQLGAIALTVLVQCTAVIAQPEKSVDLRSWTVNPGLQLPESDKPVHTFRLTGKVDKAGDASGTLELDFSAPAYDQFGYATTAEVKPPVKLECTLKFTKKGKVRIRTEPRIAAPEIDVEWLLYEVHGPRFSSRLSLAMPTEEKWQHTRLLVHDKDGKVVTVVEMREPGPPIPCHPGCFPAGTAIAVPGGTKLIERIGKGELVTMIATDGQPSRAKVASVFVTNNRLLEVRTDAGNLLTTETQPLALAAGGLRAAGELKAGDRIVRWDDGERRPTTVRSVLPTGRTEQVFNLILGEPAVFVANGFLARSKPPAAE